MADPIHLKVEGSALSVERSASTAVDADNPWPGLESYTETARQLFFGRENETDELYRLVRRQTLTVLFGQSGLGKSSLIQAGLFPLLRETDHLPLYLRLDHSLTLAGALSPSSDQGRDVAATLADQVRTALTTAFASAQVDAPAFRPEETLWEYFHRKDVDLWSPKNRLLTPVLAFDQFEEIFTLGRADAASSERSRAFLHELACLVENRPPTAVKDKFDRGELDPAHFNFGKPSCQVILSLREDFLPDLEALKQDMPALVHNRLRLKKLSGTQALEIVTKPAAHLLAAGVAERIVEFVAGAKGGSVERLAELDVEPPLLSVICRELNERRKALGQAQITTDLVSGNRREILHDFYARSIGDLPEGMRTLIEDKLLTKSGFRDNLALETALEEPGVTRPLIDTLVARRLLRIEDRLGVQRVELTHDVLAEVIRASRDERQQRLALARIQAQERLTRRRMWLARTIAASLLVGLTGVSWIAWRAVRAERRASESEARVDEARLQAEKLVTFLLDDFYAELEPTGRLEVVAKLAQQTVEYFEGLPVHLKSESTRRKQAVAMLRRGLAEYAIGRFAEGQQSMQQARKALEALPITPENRREMTLALAEALIAQSSYADDLTAAAKAVSLLRDLCQSPQATATDRLWLARAIRRNASLAESKSAGAMYEEVIQIVRGLGAAEYRDLRASALYADVLAAKAARYRSRPTEEARRSSAAALDVAAGILARQPGNRTALRVTGSSNFYRALWANAAEEDEAAVKYAREALEAYDRQTKFNPAYSIAWDWWAYIQVLIGDIELQRGNLAAAESHYRSALTAKEVQGSRAGSLNALPYAAVALATLHALRGEVEDGRPLLEEAKDLRQVYDTERSTAEFGTSYLGQQINLLRELRQFEWYAGDYRRLEQLAREDHAKLLQVLPSYQQTGREIVVQVYLASIHFDVCRASAMSGNWSAAVSAGEAALKASNDSASAALSLRGWLALALARSGNYEQADNVLAPIRERLTQSKAKRVSLAADLVVAQCAAASVSRHRGATEDRRVMLEAARSLLSQWPAEVQQLTEWKRLARLISDESEAR